MFSLSFSVGTTSESTSCGSPAATPGTISGPVGAAVVCTAIVPASLFRGAAANGSSPCPDHSTVTRLRRGLVYTRSHEKVEEPSDHEGILCNYHCGVPVYNGHRPKYRG